MYKMPASPIPEDLYRAFTSVFINLYISLSILNSEKAKQTDTIPPSCSKETKDDRGFHKTDCITQSVKMHPMKESRIDHDSCSPPFPLLLDQSFHRFHHPGMHNSLQSTQLTLITKDDRTEKPCGLRFPESSMTASEKTVLSSSTLSFRAV